MVRKLFIIPQVVTGLWLEKKCVFISGWYFEDCIPLCALFLTVWNQLFLQNCSTFNRKLHKYNPVVLFVVISQHPYCVSRQSSSNVPIYDRSWRQNTSSFWTGTSTLCTTVAGGWRIHSETAVSLTAGPHMPRWASVLRYKVHFIPLESHQDAFKALDNRFINMKVLTLTAVFHASKWEIPNERSFVLDSLDHLLLSLWSVCLCAYERERGRGGGREGEKERVLP